MIYILIIHILLCYNLYKKSIPFKSIVDRRRFLILTFIPFIGTIFHWYLRPSYKKRYELRKNSIED